MTSLLCLYVDMKHAYLHILYKSVATRHHVLPRISVLRPALRMACPRTGHYRMASFFRSSFQIPFFFVLFFVIVFLLNISIIIIIIVVVMTLPACFFLDLTILKRDVTHRMRGHPTATTTTVTSA